MHIRPIDLSITYNHPRVTSGYERFAWVFGTFDKITLRFAMNLFGDGAFGILLLSPPLPAVFFLGRRFLGRCFLGRRFPGRRFLGRCFLGRRFLGPRSSFSRSSFSRHPIQSRFDPS